jgi:hypothetical protein
LMSIGGSRVVNCRNYGVLGGRNEERVLPRMVSRMLIRRSVPQPRSRKTPTGGRMMARRTLQISLL